MLLNILKEADASGDSLVSASQISLQKSLQHMIDVGSATQIIN